MTTKVLFSLPDELVARMKVAIPARERSKVTAKLLEQEIKAREARLHLCAKELEESYGLSNEMETWEKDFGGDGLEDV